MRKMWPDWAVTIEAMIRHGAVVKVGCRKCRTVFDVDLVAIRSVRGPNFSLIDATSQCKITRCRGRSYFLAAATPDDVLQPMVQANLALFGLTGLIARRLEPQVAGRGVSDGQLV